MYDHRMSGRRVAFALATVMLVSLVFVGRLVDVQIVRAAELQEQSLQVRTTSETLWASRGSIVDQFGNDLALDVDRYDISANPSKVGDFRRAGVVVPLAQAVAEIAQVTGANYDQMLSAISADPTVQFTYLVKGVPPEAKDAQR